MNRISNIIPEEEVDVKGYNKEMFLPQEIMSNRISAIAFGEDFTTRKESPFWDRESMGDL
jgi:hypothetical protein